LYDKLMLNVSNLAIWRTT